MVDRLAQYEQPQSPPTFWRPAGMPHPNDLQQRANALLNQATRWIVEHPEVALTGAVVTGVVLGWLIKRR
jgi:ElaB/YqjD/DUF883 family membrane-anchored ribosome-binding protein